MLSKLNVLVAESNEQMASLLCSLLRSVGAQKAFPVSSTQEALQALDTGEFHAIVVDDMLGPDGGIAFTRALRARQASPARMLPVVMVFAQAEQAHIIAARDAGVTEFIRKPVSAQLLDSRITNALAKPRDFVESASYTGPDRRRRTGSAPEGERRNG